MIETALAHIARDGARALSLREVARGAGVTHTASYRHFPSKESLLAAIAEDGFRRLSDSMRAATSMDAGDPAAALQAAGVAYVEFGVRYPDHLQVMFGGLIARTEDYPGLVAASKEAYELLAAIVREGLCVGRLRGSDERTVALAAWALVHGLALLIAGGQIRERGQTAASRELAQAVTGSCTRASRPRCRLRRSSRAPALPQSVPGCVDGVPSNERRLSTVQAALWPQPL